MNGILLIKGVFVYIVLIQLYYNCIMCRIFNEGDLFWMASAMIFHMLSKKQGLSWSGHVSVVLSRGLHFQLLSRSQLLDIVMTCYALCIVFCSSLAARLACILAASCISLIYISFVCHQAVSMAYAKICQARGVLRRWWLSCFCQWVPSPRERPAAPDRFQRPLEKTPRWGPSNWLCWMPRSGVQLAFYLRHIYSILFYSIIILYCMIWYYMLWYDMIRILWKLCSHILTCLLAYSDMCSGAAYCQLAVVSGSADDRYRPWLV